MECWHLWWQLWESIIYLPIHISKWNFTVTGYPLTFIVMLTVSISVSALMTQIKMQEHVRLKAAKRENESKSSKSSVSRYPDASYFNRRSSGWNIDNKDVLTEEQKEELL